MDAGLIAAGISAAVIIISGLTTWVAVRRTASGQISTSEASVLWAQAQAMRAELVSQRDKAMEQRDRLIDAQAAQVIPALTIINESLRQITASLTRLEQDR